jgi:histidine triad (HIT) family protein
MAKIIGDEIPHAHIWLYLNPEKATGDKNDFKTNAEKIRTSIIL